MNFKDLKQLCLSHGFTNVVPLACDTIELKPEVCFTKRMTTSQHEGNFI